MNVDKQAIFEEARALLFEWYPGLEVHKGGCLYWNQVCIRTLTKHGLKPHLVAGSMFWRSTRDADPQKELCLAYEWSPNDPFSANLITKGNLPEMHIWTLLPETREMVDFSTGYFKTVSENQGGVWTVPDPPAFLWADLNALPDGVVYRPSAEATRFAWGYILKWQTPDLKEALRD